METSPLMYQIPEAARRLGIGRSLFYELLKDRGVAVVKIGRRALIPDAELRKLADELIAEARAKVAA